MRSLVEDIVMQVLAAKTAFATGGAENSTAWHGNGRSLPGFCANPHLGIIGGNAAARADTRPCKGR